MASLQWLVQHNRCLTLFVTHYPQMDALAREFPNAVSSHHMSFLEGAAESAPQVTLLYKLVAGMAPRSFGLNVARLARLPEGVVDQAARIATQLEEGVQRVRQERAVVGRLRDAVQGGDGGTLVALQQELF